MIVIFVPSPPHPLLFSRVPLALPSPSSPRLPELCVPGHRHLRTTSVRELCGREKETFFSFSLPSERHAETEKSQKFLLVPFTLFFLLVPLIVARAHARVSAYSYVPLGMSLSFSLSLIPPLTRSFLPRSSNDYPLSVQRFRAGLYLRRAASFSACRGRLIVARLCPRTCVRRIYKRRQ